MLSSATQAEEDAYEEESIQLEEDETKRLDVLLSERFEQSRSYFDALIRRGAVQVNGQARKKSYKHFRSGDVIDVRFYLEESLSLEPEEIPLEILHEDQELLIVNKPRGLVVHPAPGHWHGTLVNAVLHHLRDAPLPGAAERPGVVHRLDVDTTGVLAVAKSSMAFAALSQAFAARQVEKSYLAVVLGAPRRLLAGHLIEAPIGRCCADRRRMAVTQQGREAASYVRAVARDRSRDLTLVQVRPRTGRTHQIRVHLAHEHAPILGDATYGWRHMNRRYRGLATRPLLHAYQLRVQHPATLEDCCYTAQLPEDMRELLEGMTPEPGQEAYVSELLS